MRPLPLHDFAKESKMAAHENSLLASFAHIDGKQAKSVRHPVDAYHLIKYWYKLTTLIADTPLSHEFQALVNKQGLQLPSETDYIGVAAALLRLQRTYNLATQDLARGQIFDELSDEPLQPDDFFLLGDTAEGNSDYGLAAQWFDMATTSTDPHFPLADAFIRLARAHKAIGDLHSALEAAKKAEQADINNSSINAEKCSLLKQLEEIPNYRNETEHNMTTWQRDLPAYKSNYERMCRGDIVNRSPNVGSYLSCHYKAGQHPFVQYKEEILSRDPRISMFYDVISDNEAELIKELATPMLYRATIGDGDNVSNIRVSKLVWLWDNNRGGNGVIKRLSKRVGDITGLDTEYRDERSSAEPFQVVNYGIGGQYEPHVDYHLAGYKHPQYLEGSGDRLTTFIFYLSDMKYGGSTVFPNIGVQVPPIKNAAAFWYNAKPSGEFDDNTQHAGCPVLLGEKWIANKWIREYGQEFRRPCALDEHALWDV